MCKRFLLNLLNIYPQLIHYGTAGQSNEKQQEDEDTNRLRCPLIIFLIDHRTILVYRYFLRFSRLYMLGQKKCGDVFNDYFLRHQNYCYSLGCFEGLHNYVFYARYRHFPFSNCSLNSLQLRTKLLKFHWKFVSCALLNRALHFDNTNHSSISAAVIAFTTAIKPFSLSRLFISKLFLGV